MKKVDNVVQLFGRRRKRIRRRASAPPQSAPPPNGTSAPPQMERSRSAPPQTERSRYAAYRFEHLETHPVADGEPADVGELIVARVRNRVHLISTQPNYFCMHLTDAQALDVTMTILASLSRKKTLRAIGDENAAALDILRNLAKAYLNDTR